MVMNGEGDHKQSQSGGQARNQGCILGCPRKVNLLLIIGVVAQYKYSYTVVVVCNFSG